MRYCPAAVILLLASCSKPRRLDYTHSGNVDLLSGGKGDSFTFYLRDGGTEYQILLRSSQRGDIVLATLEAEGKQFVSIEVSYDKNMLFTYDFPAVTKTPLFSLPPKGLSSAKGGGKSTSFARQRGQVSILIRLIPTSTG